jgi:hypothetical protein
MSQPATEHGAEVERLRAENEMLRLAFCDEAYIVAVQTLDVKALGKGRRRILAQQALRMARVGLSEGLPRYSRNTDDGLRRRARELVAELASIDSGQA